MKQAHVEIALIIVNFTLLLYLVYCYTIGDRLEENFHEVIDDIVPHNHYDGNTGTAQNSGCKNNDAGSNVCIQTDISPPAQLYIDAKIIRDELFSDFNDKVTELDGYKVNLIADINTKITDLNNESTDIETCFDSIYDETVTTYTNIYTLIMDWVRLKEEEVTATDEAAQASDDASTEIKDAINDIRSEVEAKVRELYDLVYNMSGASEGLVQYVNTYIESVGIHGNTFAQASLNASTYAMSVIDNSFTYAEYIEAALSILESAKQAQLYATIAQMVANTLARIGLYTYEQLYYSSRDCDGSGCMSPRGHIKRNPVFNGNLYDLIYNNVNTSITNTKNESFALNTAVIDKINTRKILISSRKDGTYTAYDATTYGDTNINAIYINVENAQRMLKYRNNINVGDLGILTYGNSTYGAFIIYIAHDILSKVDNAQTVATEAQTAAIAAYNRVTSDKFLNDTSQFMLTDQNEDCLSPYSFFTSSDRNLCRITARQWLNEELNSSVDLDNASTSINKPLCQVGIPVTYGTPWIRWNQNGASIKDNDITQRTLCKKN